MGRSVTCGPQLFRCVREGRKAARDPGGERQRACCGPSFKPYYDYILRELAAPFEERMTGEKTGATTTGDLVEGTGSRRSLRSARARYDVKFKLLVNAADYGVPQIRWRVFVAAFRKDLGLAEWEFPRAHAVRDRALAGTEQRRVLGPATGIPPRKGHSALGMSRPRTWAPALADGARRDRGTPRATGAACRQSASTRTGCIIRAGRAHESIRATRRTTSTARRRR